MFKKLVANRQEHLFAILAFVSVAVMYMLCPWQHLHPQVWGDLSTALGLNGEVSVEHGLWRYFALALVHHDAADLPLTLHIAGAVSGAFCAAVTYLLLHMLFPLMFKTYTTEVARMRTLFNVLILALVWLLALSEGYWNLFRFFTVQTALLLFIMVAVLMLLVFLATARIPWLIACYFVTGVLAGGSMLGVILLIVVLMVLAVVKRRRITPSYSYGYGYGYGCGGEDHNPLLGAATAAPLSNPLIAERIKTPCAFALFLGMALGAGADIAFAMRSPGSSFSTVVVNAAKVYWEDIRSYADVMDVIKVTGLAVMPFLANLWFCRRATDTEKFLPRRLSLMYLVTALVAYTQISGVSRLWFWTWGGSTFMPSSPLFLAVASFLALLTVAISVLVFAVDACCRDFKRLVNNICSDMESLLKEAEEALGRTIAMGGRNLVLMKGIVFAGCMFGLCLASVPARVQAPQRMVMDAIYDFVEEAARETNGYRTLVSNGALDDALRLHIHRLGLSAKVVAVYDAPSSVGDAVEGVAWMTDLPWCLLDGGWDFSGLMARRKVDAAESARSRAKMRELAERFIAFDRDGTLAKTYDRFLARASDVIKWQLARSLNSEAQAMDGKLEPAECTRLEEMASALDQGNRSLQAVLGKLDGAGTQANVELTPLEGLELALDRGDLDLARRYVDIVLRADAENALALYAQGMIYLKDERPALAAESLKRSVAKLPNEAAVLNNLAVALSRAGRRDEAREWLRKASALPNAQAVIKANAKILAAPR